MSDLPALYVLAHNYREALDALAECDDPQAIADTLESVRGPLAEKAQNTAYWILNNEVMVKAIDAAIQKLEARKARYYRRAMGGRTYLLAQMDVAKVDRLDSPDLEIVRRKNPPKTMIDDVTQIPAEYFHPVKPVTPQPDKDKIKRAIQSGETVPGAHLQASTRIEIG